MREGLDHSFYEEISGLCCISGPPHRGGFCSLHAFCATLGLSPRKAADTLTKEE